MIKKTNKTTKKANYWSNNCTSTICTGVRYNKTTGNYYVRKAGKYLGSFTSKKKAVSAYNTGSINM